MNSFFGCYIVEAVWLSGYVFVIIICLLLHYLNIVVEHEEIKLFWTWLTFLFCIFESTWQFADINACKMQFFWLAKINVKYGGEKISSA